MAAEVTLGLIIELLIDGIGNGLIFALAGLAITLVFGLGGVLNLSIGVFALLGILVAHEVMTSVHSLALGFVAAMVAVGLIGLVVDRTLLSLVYRSEGEERMLVGIFATLGLAFFLEGLLVLRYPDLYSIDQGVGLQIIGGLLIRGASIAAIAVAVVAFVILYIFFDRTYAGQAARTVMQDEVGATLCGIDTRQMRTFVFVLSAVIAAVAGIIYSFSGEVNVAESFQLTIFAVIVSVVGGVTSIVGAVVAGLLLGIITTFASAFVGAYLAEVSLFVAAILVLLLRPEEIA